MDPWAAAGILLPGNKKTHIPTRRITLKMNCVFLLFICLIGPHFLMLMSFSIQCALDSLCHDSNLFIHPLGKERQAAFRPGNLSCER